jgi:hypothetical protein
LTESGSIPIYIPSKGRSDSCLTMRALEAMGVSYLVIVEEQQYDDYAETLGKHRLLVLDIAYQREYDTFDNLGLSKSTGPGPARNFAWDHAIASGHSWHWVMDDNIRRFFRLNKNLKVPVNTSAIFTAMEEFVDRYTNVAMAGPNYFMFASRKSRMPPFKANTRIYSCNLIRNDVPFRWRGRYNEDTDLSLRMLKAGWCTIQFNAFLQEKTTTQTLGGGNTAEFYAKEGTAPKSEMLVRMHPDVARIAYRFGRIHHYVNYKPFAKNRLRRRSGVATLGGVNNYGMVLKQKTAPTPTREDGTPFPQAPDSPSNASE